MVNKKVDLSKLPEVPEMYTRIRVDARVDPSCLPTQMENCSLRRGEHHFDFTVFVNMPTEIYRNASGYDRKKFVAEALFDCLWLQVYSEEIGPEGTKRLTATQKKALQDERSEKVDKTTDS